MRNTYKVHGGAFQPAAHLGRVELVLAPRYWKWCHCGGSQRQKSGKNNYIKHSTSERYKNWIGRQNRGSLFCRCFPSLKTEMVRLAGFSAHSCVALELWLEVHHCTAVWLMKGGEGKLRIKGKRWRSSRTSPAGPGTCPGQQLQLLLWRKSQLSLATSDNPPVSSPLAPAFIQKPSLSSVFSNSPSYSRDELENYKGIYQGAIRSLCLRFCALSVVFSALTPPNDSQSGCTG